MSRPLVQGPPHSVTAQTVVRTDRCRPRTPRPPDPPTRPSLNLRVPGDSAEVGSTRAGGRGWERESRNGSPGTTPVETGPRLTHNPNPCPCRHSSGLSGPTPHSGKDETPTERMETRLFPVPALNSGPRDLGTRRGPTPTRLTFVPGSKHVTLSRDLRVVYVPSLHLRRGRGSPPRTYVPP